MAAYVPVTFKGSSEAGHSLAIARLVKPGEGRTQVRQLDIEAIEPQLLFGTSPCPGRGLLRQGQEPLRMRLPGWSLLATRRQVLEPELAHGFQQEISWLAVGPRFLSQEALVNERGNAGDDVEGETAGCRRDGLDGLDHA